MTVMMIMIGWWWCYGQGNDNYGQDLDNNDDDGEQREAIIDLVRQAHLGGEGQ